GAGGGGRPPASALLDDELREIDRLHRGRALEGSVDAVDDLVAQEGRALRRADIHACLLVKSGSRRSRTCTWRAVKLVGHPGAEELHLQRRLQVALAVLVAEVGDEGLEGEERADGRLRRLLQKRREVCARR